MAKIQVLDEFGMPGESSLRIEVQILKGETSVTSSATEL